MIRYWKIFLISTSLFLAGLFVFGFWFLIGYGDFHQADSEEKEFYETHFLMECNRLKAERFEILNNSNSALLTGKDNIKETTSYITGYWAGDVAVNNLPQNNDKIEEIKILFFGDLMLDRYVGELIKKNGLDYLFQNIKKEFWENYDLIIANLEGAITNEGKHYSPVLIYDFAFQPELIKELKDRYNFNFFILANNHISDQGERGMLETKNNLNDLDINYVGCADRVVADCSFKIINLKNKKIALAAYSMVYGLANEEKILDHVKNLASTSDVVLVSMHWGKEYQNNFNKIQQDLAHKIIKAGADMIIGHHPHVVQGMEIFQGKPIFYSLGNFIFDQYFSPETQEHLGLNIKIEENNFSTELIPMKSKTSQLSLMNEEEKKIFMKKFLDWSNLNAEEKLSFPFLKFQISNVVNP